MSVYKEVMQGNHDFSSLYGTSDTISKSTMLIPPAPTLLKKKSEQPRNNIRITLNKPGCDTIDEPQTALLPPLRNRALLTPDLSKSFKGLPPTNNRVMNLLYPDENIPSPNQTADTINKSAEMAISSPWNDLNVLFSKVKEKSMKLDLKPSAKSMSRNNNINCTGSLQRNGTLLGTFQQIRESYNQTPDCLSPGLPSGRKS